jgi:hypothetical protein
MIRTLKSLCLALAVAAAAASFSAAGASAAQFHSEAAPTTLSGGSSTTYVFSFGAGQVNCTETQLSGSMATKTVESITLTPVFAGGCDVTYTGVGTALTSIWLNGCDLGASANGTGSINCPSGAAIEFPSGSYCTVKFFPTAGASGVTYVNNGNAIDVSFALTGVSWSTTTSSPLGCKKDSGASGGLTGTSVLTGKNSGGTQVKIWHE